MKRPHINDYKAEVWFNNYVEDLNKYIDYLESKDLKCKHNFGCGIEYCELKKCEKFEMK